MKKPPSPVKMPPRTAKVLKELANLPEPDLPPTTIGNTTASIPPPPATSLLFTLGKPYNPKSERNTDTWLKIKAALADGPKTLADITDSVKEHKDFVGYMVRGSHIIVQQLHIPAVPPS